MKLFLCALVLVSSAALFFALPQTTIHQTNKPRTFSSKELKNGSTDPQSIIHNRDMKRDEKLRREPPEDGYSETQSDETVERIVKRGSELIYTTSENGHPGSEIVNFDEKANKRDKKLIRKPMQEENVDTKTVGIVKQVYKRDTPSPVQVAESQLSAVVYMMNAAILGEAIVRKLTTFGEISIGLMMIQNMPADEDWVSLIGSTDIDMSLLGDLQKAIEEGYKTTASTDLIEKTVKIADGLGVFNSVAQASQRMNNILTKYGNEIQLLFDAPEALQALGSLTEAVPVLSAVKNISSLEALKIGSQIIKDVSENEITINNAFGMCNSKEVEEDCMHYLRSALKNVTVDQIIVKDIELVAEVIRVIHNVKTYNNELGALFLNKQNFNDIKKQFLNVFDLLKTSTEGITARKNDFANITLTLDEVKGKSAELGPLATTIGFFQPFANIIEKVKKGKSTRVRIRSTKTTSVSMLKSFQGLPEGETCLEDLVKSTGSSALLPKNYQASKIVERVEMMNEFVAQRKALLGVSEGIGAVNYVLSIIKNLKSNSFGSLNGVSLEKGIDLTKSDNKNLASVGDVSKGKTALENIGKLIDSYDNPQWENVRTTISTTHFTFKTEPFLNLFRDLGQTADFIVKAKEAVKDGFKSPEKAFENIKKMGTDFHSGMGKLRTLTEVIKNNKNAIRIATDVDVNQMAKIISALPQNGSVTQTMSTKELKSGFAIVEKTKTTIDGIIPKKHEYASFSSEIAKVMKLNDNVPERPKRESIVALEPMLKEMQSMKPLTVRPELKNDKPSPFMDKLMKGEPYGSEVLGEVSKGLMVYRKMVKDVPSVESLKNPQPSPLVAGMLEGVDSIQVVPVADEFNAYNVFRDWSILETGLTKLEKYVNGAVEKKKDGKVAAEIKSGKGLVYTFFGRLDASSAEAIASLKHGISTMIESLRQADCEKSPDDPTCAYNVNNKNSSESGSWLIMGISLGIAGILLIAAISVIVWFVLKRKKDAKVVPVEKPKVIKLNELIQFKKGLLFIEGFEKYSKEKDLKVFIQIQRGEFETLKKPIPVEEGKNKDHVERILNSDLRSTGLYLFEENMVILKSGALYSASRITNIKKMDVIACEAPVLKTVPLFCEMLIQENVSIVVQLCTFAELTSLVNNKNVSRPYINFDDNQYTIKSQRVASNITVENHPNAVYRHNSKITVKKTGATHEFVHFAHAACPDRAVPRENISFLLIIAEVKKLLKDKPGKLVVHCMAGLGRTMVFNNILCMIEMAENGRTDIVVSEVANSMKELRNDAVQNALQYMYIQIAMAKYFADTIASKEIVDFYEEYSKIFSKIRGPWEHQNFDEKVTAKALDALIAQSRKQDENRLKKHLEKNKIDYEEFKLEELPEENDVKK